MHDSFSFHLSACDTTFKHGISCYDVNINAITGNDAKTACQGKSHLVYIESRGEQEYLESILAENYERMDFWIGLTRYSDYDIGLWEWLNGVALPFWTQDPFNDNEPCFRMARVASYKWSDWSCEVPFGFICERGIGRYI